MNRITFGALIVSVFLLLLPSCGGPPPPAGRDARMDRIETLYQGYRKGFPAVNEVSPQGVLDLQNASPTVLVDVRTLEEQAVSMLPGAITRDAFEAARDVYADQTVVTYCTIGARSGVYADELRREGVEVFNLKGSILSWTQAGLPLVDGEGHDTTRVHTYGSQWELLGEGYEAVYD